MFTLALGALTAHPIVSALALTFAVVGMAWAAGEPFLNLLSQYGLVSSTTQLLTPLRNVIVKTADYAMTGAEDSGSLFTTTGAAGAVNFTLPAPTALLKGKWFGFRNAVAQNMTLTGKNAGDIVTFNNAAAASVAASTLNQKIGAHMVAICDGTKWHVEGTTVGVTYTVA